MNRFKPEFLGCRIYKSVQPDRDHDNKFLNKDYTDGLMHALCFRILFVNNLVFLYNKTLKGYGVLQKEILLLDLYCL